MADAPAPDEILPPHKSRRACGHVVEVEPGKDLNRRMFEAVKLHLDSCPEWQAMKAAR